MIKFNAKKIEEERTFQCKNCNSITGYLTACNGCPSCGHYLFKVADRAGTPELWNWDKRDPYLRQKQKGLDSGNHGDGYKLVTPGDEEEFSGLGTRFRGHLAPTDFSETSQGEYANQKKTDLPEESTNLDFFPTEGQQGWFADSNDPLSSTQMMNRQNAIPKSSTPFDRQLAKQRNHTSIKTRLDDSIYSRYLNNLKGHRR